MSTLNRSKPYAAIAGHPRASYEQDGLLYDGAGNLLGTPPTVAKSVEEHNLIQTDQLVSAQEFLKNVLASGAVSKATLYKEAENNNQPWDAVKDASIALNVMKFKFKQSEMWRLSEPVE